MRLSRTKWHEREGEESRIGVTKSSGYSIDGLFTVQSTVQ